MSFLRWRPLILLLVLAAHGGAAAALVAGKKPPPPIMTAPVLTAALIGDEAETVVAAPAPEVRPEPKPKPKPKPVPIVRAKPAEKPVVAPPSALAAVAVAAVTTTPPTPLLSAPVAPMAVSPPLRHPAAISCTAPAYPAEARRRGETGIVLLRLLIAPDGAVVQSQVLRSSGSSALDAAAVAGLSKCKFSPGTIDGRAQTAWVRLRYVWKLE